VSLLEIQDLRRAFYGLDVLRGVDLSVAPGGITGLIGPNGATERSTPRRTSRP